MIFEISVLELVEMDLLPKLRQKCPWAVGVTLWAPVYLTKTKTKKG